MSLAFFFFVYILSCGSICYIKGSAQENTIFVNFVWWFKSEAVQQELGTE